MVEHKKKEWVPYGIALLLSFQLCVMIYTNIYPIFSANEFLKIEITGYSIYVISTFIFLLLAKAYFLIFGIKNQSPVDVRYSFMIITYVLTGYMILRDISFIYWKGYYF